MPLETGSLVTLYRRINPGIGMVVEKIDDIFSVSKNGQKDLEKLIRSWNNGNNLKTRNYAISNFIEESEIEDNLVISFLQSNGFYRYSQVNPKKNICKIKKTFVKIFWFSNPSDYNIKIIRRNIDWFPMEWLKAPKKPKKIT